MDRNNDIYATIRARKLNFSWWTYILHRMSSTITPYDIQIDQLRKYQTLRVQIVPKYDQIYSTIIYGSSRHILLIFLLTLKIFTMLSPTKTLTAANLIRSPTIGPMIFKMYQSYTNCLYTDIYETLMAVLLLFGSFGLYIEQFNHCRYQKVFHV